MKHEQTKQAILEIGLDIFRRYGFHNTGIKEILDRAKIPKGSFYHYFKSKDDFGLQTIDLYASRSNEIYQDISEQFPSGMERIQAFFNHVCRKMENEGFCGGCFMGNLSQELADTHEEFKKRLEEHWNHSCQLLAEWVRQAQDEGAVSRELDPREIANFLLNSYQGAVLRSKVCQSYEPFNQFLDMVFGRILISN